VKRSVLLLVLLVSGCAQPAEIRVGSKRQPESVILGEMVTLLARSTGAQVDHRRALGGTQVLWKALLNDEIQVYTEYTGTISAEILVDSSLRNLDVLRQRLDQDGIVMSQPLGFNDTYAIGMRKDAAQRLGISKISDLRNHPTLKFGFSNEFMERADGWPGLRHAYGLPQKDVRGLEHDLAYQGLVSGAIDATDLYSTDAKIRSLNLLVLVDDRKYFPAYEAVLLFRKDLPQRAPAVVQAFLRMQGQISDAAMIDMNARVEIDREDESRVAADFLASRLGIQVQAQSVGGAERILRLTWQHLFLVAVSLAAAVLIAVPLGVLAARRPRAGQAILATAGIFQTIPSIALLVFMIPLLGIGAKPAIAALFLYSLLPIIQNTYAGLHSIPGHLVESAEALGLPALARLRLVELPMAARTILAGIKTAAVINVGTATLGGFIGAGGYGEVIFTGISKSDTRLILLGAVPAALLALVVQGLFELAERTLVPKGLRLQAE
jgi:osmoprotectant transport system permease protein